MVQRVVIGRKPKHKAKKHGIVVRGCTRKDVLPRPQPKPELEPVLSFDEVAESNGAELKRQHPELTNQIDQTVEKFKKRHANNELHDWLDTWDEFTREALRPLPKPYKSGKRSPK